MLPAEAIRRLPTMALTPASDAAGEGKPRGLVEASVSLAPQALTGPSGGV